MQERARNRALEAQLTELRDARWRAARQRFGRSDTPAPTQAPATNKPAAAPRSREATSRRCRRATSRRRTAAQPTAPEAPGNLGSGPPDGARQPAAWSQGNIGAARIVLERAAETGSAPALFALAETYDPAVLSAWGTFGTQGDVAKAQELYAKALGRRRSGGEGSIERVASDEVGAATRAWRQDKGEHR